jgi:8-oxo-dGTP diphosphatase
MARVPVFVDLTVFTIREGELRVLVEKRARDPFRGLWCLPHAPLDPGEALEAAARRILAGLRCAGAYLEQLYTFGDPGRDPRGPSIAVAYLAVVPARRIPEGTTFQPAQRPPRLAFDHARILEQAVSRLRTKSEYSTVPLRFLAEPFTLSEVQAVYEVLLDRPLDKRNFRRKMLALGALDQTEGERRGGAHRPARLFRLAPKHPYLLKERGILFPF